MMDLKPDGLLRLFVLVSLLLGVQVMPVLLAPLSFSCEDDMEKTKNLLELLETQAEHLLKVYETYLGSFANDSHEDIPDSTVSGENFSEKLLDIYAKDEIFSLHLSKVKRYLEDLLVDPQLVENPLVQVEGSIDNLLIRVQQIVRALYPDESFPPKPKPLNITLHDFEKKKYGWHVINGVRCWGAQAAQVLEEGEKECEN